jgi:hypothetical protein
VQIYKKTQKKTTTKQQKNKKPTGLFFFFFFKRVFSNPALRMSLRLRFTLPRPATMLVRLSMAMASVTLARLVFKIGPDSSSTCKKRRSYKSVAKIVIKLNTRRLIQPGPEFYDLTGTVLTVGIYVMYGTTLQVSTYLLSVILTINHFSSAKSIINSSSSA